VSARSHPSLDLVIEVGRPASRAPRARACPLFPGLYDIEYDEGQVEENVAPTRIRIAPGGLDPWGSLTHLFVATFTIRGRLSAMGIAYDVVRENHSVPTRFNPGDKILIYGRNGVFTVTGFAGSSDATITLIGLARDKLEDEEEPARRAVSSAVPGDEETQKAMKKKKKLSSLNNDDLKPMQLYYPQASWRLAEIENHEVGAEVLCRRGGDEDAKLEYALILSKAPVFHAKRSAAADPAGFCRSCFAQEEQDFDPVRSTYVVRYLSDGREEQQKAKDVLGKGADGAPLRFGLLDGRKWGPYLLEMHEIDRAQLPVLLLLRGGSPRSFYVEPFGRARPSRADDEASLRQLLSDAGSSALQLEYTGVWGLPARAWKTLKAWLPAVPLRALDFLPRYSFSAAFGLLLVALLARLILSVPFDEPASPPDKADKAD
jgi:hypothetical protein